MILGYRLRMLRRQKGMSQSDLGNLLGVSKVSVSGYENGSRVPSLEILLGILNVFDISADYILGRELDVVCEDDDKMHLTLASSDIEIIREIRSRPKIYYEIVKDPKRFFNIVDKNNI